MNTSRYVTYLPSLLQADETLGKFLLAFEKILSGLPAATDLDRPANLPNPRSLEDSISQLHLNFDPNPDRAPEEFLPWLANWVGLTLREDWSDQSKRELIRRMVELYRLRGTKAGLEQLLKIYLGADEAVRIDEFDQPAHYFQVQLKLASRDLEQFNTKQRVARAIINQEKPAHTYYGLRILMPTMQLVSEQYLRQKGLSGTELKKNLLRIGNRKDHLNNTVLGSTTTTD
ncbi:phage tail protein I [Leptolyngbya sp. AN03gr2]|uniref:phage tail protein I n=1 Tax=unclassified Leptolyngbya TaxID=2650499 RepID=UPI003D31DE88